LVKEKVIYIVISIDMNRPASPHPIKLKTILEDYESKTFQTSTQNYQYEKLISELEEIKNDIKEIKNKLK
jgi:hypothetical protein